MTEESKQDSKTPIPDNYTGKWDPTGRYYLRGHLLSWMRLNQLVWETDTLEPWTVEEWAIISLACDEIEEEAHRLANEAEGWYEKAERKAKAKARAAA